MPAVIHPKNLLEQRRALAAIYRTFIQPEKHNSFYFSFGEANEENPPHLNKNVPRNTPESKNMGGPRVLWTPKNYIFYIVPARKIRKVTARVQSVP